MAIGLLVEEGKLSLDENIYDIFQKKLNTFNKIFRPKVTVENLLTMTSGVTFNESGIVSGNDWLTSYLNSSISGTPGENFQYNSLIPTFCPPSSRNAPASHLPNTWNHGFSLPLESPDISGKPALRALPKAAGDFSSAPKTWQN